MQLGFLKNMCSRWWNKFWKIWQNGDGKKRKKQADLWKSLKGTATIILVYFSHRQFPILVDIRDSKQHSSQQIVVQKYLYEKTG